MPSKIKDLRVILGKGGKGKSVLARAMLKAHKRVIIFDVNAEDENAEGAVVCETKGQLVRAISADKKPFRVCWRGFLSMGKEAYEFGNEAAIAAENCTLHWEEVDRFIGPNNLSPMADKIINAGRHWGIKVLACSRRAARVPRDLTANASRIIAFGTTEPNDIKYLKDYIGQELAEKLPKIEQYHAVDWTEQKAGVKKSPFR